LKNAIALAFESAIAVILLIKFKNAIALVCENATATSPDRLPYKIEKTSS
jgi:hypothetical protein